MPRLSNEMLAKILQQPGYGIVNDADIDTDLSDAAQQVAESSEYNLQKAIFDAVAIRALRSPAYMDVICMPLGQYRPGLRAEAGLRHSRGTPDILILCARHGFHGGAIELKIGDNEPSARQDMRMQRLVDNGWFVAVLREYEATMDTIEWYLGGDND